MNMDDEVLPASLEKLKLDNLSSSCPHITFTENTRSLSRSVSSDYSYLFKRRSMPSRSMSTAISPRGIKSTTNFKPSRNERALGKNKKNSIIKEAVLKLNNTGSNCLSDDLTNTLFKKTCKFSISWKNKKILGHGKVAKDFKALNINHDSRQTKDDTSIQDGYQINIFQRAHKKYPETLRQNL